MTFYEFASNNPWLTFFLGCLVVAAVSGAADAFRPKVICTCKAGESESTASTKP